MKTSITLTFACLFLANYLTQAIYLKEDQKHKLHSYLQQCFIEEKASEDEVHKINNWDVEYPSEKIKCVSACFFEKFGALKDNKVQKEGAAQNLRLIMDERRTQGLIEKCKDIKGSDRCDMGFNMFKCIFSYKAF